VNQHGCPRGSAFVFTQRSIRVLRETLASLAVGEKLGNSALERVGIADLDRTVI
jgi:hypothetical protein